MGDISRRLRVGAFAETQSHHGGITRGASRRRDVKFLVNICGRRIRRAAPPAFDRRARHVVDVPLPCLRFDSLPDRRADFRVERLIRPLPDVSPPVVERVGGRPRDEHLVILRERQKFVCILVARAAAVRRGRRRQSFFSWQGNLLFSLGIASVLERSVARALRRMTSIMRAG